MKLYKKILLAVDLEHVEAKVVLTALDLAKEFAADLWAMYVIEHMKGYDALYYQINFDVEKALMEEAQQKMVEFAKKYKIPEDRQIIKMGVTKFNLLQEAQEIKSDLIVVGTHGRHGVQLLLGSTANAVLHGAECDVLVVHLKERE